MKRSEARAATLRARACLREGWLILLDIHDRGGWRAMGYSSYGEYAAIELYMSRGQAYRLLEAAQVQKGFLESGTLPEDAPHKERHLRELAKIDCPALRKEIWEEAQTDGEPTAKNIEELVSNRQGQSGDDEKDRDWEAGEYDVQTTGDESATPGAPPVIKRLVVKLGRLVGEVTELGKEARPAVVMLGHALKVLEKIAG